MNVRVNTVRGATNTDTGIAYLHEKLLPLLHQQAGYRGGMTSVDRTGAVAGLIALWENKDALEASEAVAAKARAEAVSLIGGDVAVETLEQVVSEIGNPPPAKGCLVRFVSFETDPARLDENVTFFRAEALPAIKGSPGFRAVRNLVNRTTGRGLTAIIVSDQDALRAAEISFDGRRETAETRGVRFGEITHREVVPGRQAIATQLKPASMPRGSSFPGRRRLCGRTLRCSLSSGH